MAVMDRVRDVILRDGSTLRLRGKGAPRSGGGHGDQLVRLKVVLPKQPDPKLEAFVADWAEGKDFNPRDDRAA